MCKNKQELLEFIIRYYLESFEFNGVPNYNLEDYNNDDIVSLIQDGLVETISDNDANNIYIKGFDLNLTLQQHINNANGLNGQVCFYPTSKALRNVAIDTDRPYTALMQRGCPQLKILYFNVEVLERYINNPQYIILDYGYKGSICLKDEFEDVSLHQEYIQEYAMAYKRGEKLIRAVGVFLCDLMKLSPKAQYLWKSFEYDNQKDYFASPGFIKNAFYGAWVNEYWVLDAILKEMGVINKQCEAIGIPSLFSHVYSDDRYERPNGYGSILLPTMKNYYDFVSVMEKLIVHNISFKTFQKKAIGIEPIERKAIDGTCKGSLVMLKEWIDQNVKAPFVVDDLIIKPLKEIRKIRQIPAHELPDNKYDTDVYEMQRELVNKSYLALKAIRCLLMSHPLAKSVQVPKCLLEEDKIVFY